MLRRHSLLLALPLLAFAAKSTPQQLIDLAKNPADPAFEKAIRDTFPASQLNNGAAIAGEGANFFWALESATPAETVIDDNLFGTMRRLPNTQLTYLFGQLSTGRSHRFIFQASGKVIAEKNDVPAYGPYSYEKPGIPKGTLSEKIVSTSTVYPGMETEWWIYAPAQYDAAKPAALMVWQDGQGMIDRNGSARAGIVFDNLTAEGKIPVMIHVFIAPGKVGTKAMRSIEYDTVNADYVKFLETDIYPEVMKRYKVRTDAYSHAIAGNSSGGICAFNAAWMRNDAFTRVLSRIGSFTSIQWHPGQIDGGNVYPFKIRKEPKHNIRTWLQDGSEDLENQFGSWPLQNIQMANSLKREGYDFHLSFGNGTHNGAHGNSELPQEMIWLWRGYDPAKSEETFAQEQAEKDNPTFYRIKTLTRQAIK